MTTRLQQSDVEQLLLSQNIQLASTYTRTTSPITVKCLTCNHVRSTNAGKLLYEVRKGNCPCPNCAGTLSLTDVEIDNRLTGRSVKRMSSYESDLTPMTWECTDCSHQWQTRATKVLNEHTNCPNCSYNTRSERRKLSPEEINRRLVGRNITLQSPYTNTTTPHRWTCTACNHSWVTTPDKVLREFTGCPHCAPDGSYGRKTKRGTLCFDSGLEAYCYDVLTTFFDSDDIVLQHRYPHNNRMKADFYIPTHNLWIEVSNIKTTAYTTKIAGKRQAVEQAGGTFIFASGPNQLRSLVTITISKEI